METAQLNVRIDPGLKAAGDRVLERFGVSAVHVVRSAWQYMADHQKLPDFVEAGSSVSKAEAQAVADRGIGMAVRLARESGLRAELDAMTFSELRESAFEEMLIEEAERAERGEGHA